MTIAFLLLRGKEFSLPDDVSSGIIGLFFGLLCGLFFYQHYYKPYFWAISLAGGLFFTLISHDLFQRMLTDDDTRSIWLTITSFALPFLLTLVLNYGLYYIKHTKRQKRMKRRRHSQFFDTLDTIDAASSTNTGKDIAS